MDSQRTVTASWYIKECFPKVVQKPKEILPNSRMDIWHFHHDNAPAHRAHATIDFFNNTGVKVLDHPAYSPNLASCDFALFRIVKVQFKDKKFVSDSELLAAWDQVYSELPEEKWNDFFDYSFLFMIKCINCNGNYLNERLQ